MVLETMSSLCMQCKILPPAKPKRRCNWCLSKQAGTDMQVASRYEHWFAGTDPEHCKQCDRDVPKFYMVSGVRCKACALASQRARKDVKLYGLNPEDRDAMYIAQEGICWGCQKRQIVSGLAVHHSHLSGEAFFLACLTCNHDVLGSAQDNPMILLRLALGMYYPPHKDNNMARIERIIGELTQ